MSERFLINEWRKDAELFRQRDVNDIDAEVFADFAKLTADVARQLQPGAIMNDLNAFNVTNAEIPIECRNDRVARANWLRGMLADDNPESFLGSFISVIGEITEYGLQQKFIRPRFSHLSKDQWIKSILDKIDLYRARLFDETEFGVPPDRRMDSPQEKDFLSDTTPPEPEPGPRDDRKIVRFAKPKRAPK